MNSLTSIPFHETVTHLSTSSARPWVVYHSEGHSFTAGRSINLPQPTTFSWRMPPSFDTKPNMVNLTCLKRSQSNRRCPAIVSCSPQSTLSTNGFIHKDSYTWHVLWPVTWTCYPFHYVFQVSPFYKNEILGKLSKEVLWNNLNLAHPLTSKSSLPCRDSVLIQDPYLDLVVVISAWNTVGGFPIEIKKSFMGLILLFYWLIMDQHHSKYINVST